MDKKKFPILRSSARLRPERFGGFILNHYIPPEISLDHIRYKIAAMCDGAHSLDDIQYHLAENLDHSPEYIEKLITETLGQIEGRLMLYWREQPLDDPLELPAPFDDSNGHEEYMTAPTSVIWEITRSCNLKCKHCFSSSGPRRQQELTTVEAKNMLDTLADHRVFYVNITGGEPLMRKDLFELLDYAAQRRLSIDLSTNGFLVDENNVKALLDTNVFTVQVSVDGMREHHDQFRGVPGSFTRIEKAVALLKDAKFGVVVSTTINKSNLKQIPEMIDWAISVGADSFKSTLFMPQGRGKTNIGELDLSPEEVKWLAETMAVRRKEFDDKIQLNLESCYPWLMDAQPPKERQWYQREHVGCAAGTSTLFITANGDAVPCPFLTNMVLGNFRDNDFNKIWKSELLEPFRTLKPNSLKGQCGSCELLGSICFGGCRAAALTKSGDIYGEDPYCWKGARSESPQAV
jgi:radical SAM protein with 4Fe4S-binding SPASM domain